MGNDEGLELDETDEDEKLDKGDEEQVEEDEGEDVGESDRRALSLVKRKTVFLMVTT